MIKFEIGMPVIFKGKFATVTGFDNGEERIIIEFCSHEDGKFLTVSHNEIELDLEALDNDF